MHFRDHHQSFLNLFMNFFSCIYLKGEGEGEKKHLYDFNKRGSYEIFTFSKLKMISCIGLLNLYLLHTVIWNWNYEYCILCSKYHPSILCAYSFFPQDNALLVQLKHFCRSGMKLTALVNNVTCYIFITCRNLATAFLVHKHPVVTCVWLGKIIISHSITSFLRGVQNDTCKQFTSLIWLLLSKRLRHESLWQNRLVFSL